MRVPIELLSGLANCLLNDTVFEIVKGLMEIQHVTEKHLFQQRLQIINNHACKLYLYVLSYYDLRYKDCIFHLNHHLRECIFHLNYFLISLGMILLVFCALLLCAKF